MSRAASVKPLGADRAAVSDVLGALMMVGITVMAAVGFGIILFSFDGPTDAQHTRLTASVTAGDGDWGDGDELLRLAHVGGEPLKRSEALVVFTTTSGTTSLSGNDLGSAFSDGQLTIGEVWTRGITADEGDVIEVRIVATGEQSQLLTSNSIVAGASATALCVGDVAPPTASVIQSPPNIDSLSVGAVTVTATIRDLCSDVLDAPKPHLFYCIAVTCVVPTSYTDAGEMAEVGAPGAHQWSKNIPHAGSWLLDGIAGRSLNYYLSPVSDDVPNSGSTAVRTDPVDLVATYTPVDNGFATVGLLEDLVNAKTGPDAVEAELAEGAVNAPAGTGGPTKFSGTTVATGGGTSVPDNAKASDNARTVMDNDADAIELSGFANTLPANIDGITALSIGLEGRRVSTAGGTNPQWRLDYRTGASYVNGAFTSEASTTDINRTRSLCTTAALCTAGGFTAAAVQGMSVRVSVNVANGANLRNLEIDHVYATVTYTTAAATTYTMTVQLNWTAVPAGSVQQAVLTYRTAGDTFTPQVWRFSGAGAGTWRSCGVGALSSASLTTYTCPLVAADELSSGLSGGQVRMRFVDVATTGTAQGKLFIDYARMATA